MGFSASSSFQAGNTAGLVERIRGAARTAAANTADHVLFMSQVAVPIDTGELQRSGNVTVEETADGVTAFVNYDSDHAIYPEFGTARMAAQPYLRPSLDESHEALMANAKTEVQSVL